ncbi:MAG: hypothetical protein WD939_04300 [Dehalococcoidia bacterium]
MELLNQVFGTALILNDGHEILARLEAGDEIADIGKEVGEKFGKPGVAEGLRQVISGWPPLHVEAVESMLRWALGKLDTDQRVTIKWKGDAEHNETVTKFELRNHTLVIEFAHPPLALASAS